MIQRDPEENRQSDANADSDDRKRQNTGDSSAGSQAATTRYGTGDAGAQGTAPVKKGKDTPSNAGNANFNADEAAGLSDGRTEQMAHADGSSEADDPNV